MRNACAIMLAGLFTVFSFSSSDAQTNKKPPFAFARQQQRPSAYSVQTASVHANCFPLQLRAILAYIAGQTRHNPMVTSGYRPHANRRGSLHRRCMAADIRVPGVAERVVIAAARRTPGIGGIGSYCNGIIHVDIGPKRHWTDC